MQFIGEQTYYYYHIFIYIFFFKFSSAELLAIFFVEHFINEDFSRKLYKFFNFSVSQETCWERERERLEIQRIKYSFEAEKVLFEAAFFALDEINQIETPLKQFFAKSISSTSSFIKFGSAVVFTLALCLEVHSPAIAAFYFTVNQL